MRRQWLGIWATLFLGITFVVAGAGKIFAQSDSLEPLLLPEFLSSFLTQSISIVVPYVEIIIGVLLILGIAVKLTTSLSALMIAELVASNVILITLGLATEPCGCFGGLAGGGLSVGVSLVLDGIMAIMVLIIFLFYPGSFSSIKPWCFTGEEKTIDNIKTLKKGELTNE